ncbi:phosphonate metabolism transcriptional regulator PhnF [Chelatococcus asaccharovorans]|uniref:GntR family phosphonate transport system transcriptional regulator n=1 Tax=Chelatococcus asaccharovorans TaxID=28210 RepID=A0A2V3TVZ9_9HYPH|nr:phosphonate metabolism transcriptional regulator PhnF [Chelatococcus asaccharovorans]MBS7705152.1 phosphonate metabolism transcriptional regulator PhnF [Chelatococcus asaccharovorans]PXW53648.1 GntR family phosphonate transport system transcriptional regulator [Chelatococcus asaccharovorans]CAH1652936.1 Transcriptional regulator PhnF [Chelatococcus asaccharovorans]CAH1686193.1 Transcriptional regulator PhnF [Chelatococcus asaccharovorans]
MQNLNERDGVSLWRQIGDALIREIESGELEVEKRLPSSDSLASRFGVNRHTVLKAISHLQAEGYVRVQRGRGTYAVVNRMEYRIGPRRWFEESLLQSKLMPSRTIVMTDDLSASAEIASSLRIAEGSPVFFLKILGEADGFPVNFGCHYFPLERLPTIGDVFRSYGDKPTADLSFTKVFNEVGVTDFRRKSVRIRSRLPSQEEAWRLRMPQTEQVIETDVVNVDAQETPVVFANTCFCSSRVELVLEL